MPEYNLWLNDLHLMGVKEVRITDSAFAETIEYIKLITKYAELPPHIHIIKGKKLYYMGIYFTNCEK